MKYWWFRLFCRYCCWYISLVQIHWWVESYTAHALLNLGMGHALRMYGIWRYYYTFNVTPPYPSPYLLSLHWFYSTLLSACKLSLFISEGQREPQKKNRLGTAESSGAANKEGNIRIAGKKNSWQKSVQVSCEKSTATQHHLCRSTIPPHALCLYDLLTEQDWPLQSAAPEWLAQEWLVGWADWH